MKPRPGARGSFILAASQESARPPPFRDGVFYRRPGAGRAMAAAPDCIGDQSRTVQDCWELLPCPAPDSRLPIGPDRPPEI